MNTIDISIQWTQTGGCNALSLVRNEDGFYSAELGAIDAPVFLPTGCAIRNEYVSYQGEDVVSIQGCVIPRPGSFDWAHA
jgi:hypothetical protein